MRLHGKWLASTAILTVGFAFAPPPALQAQTSVALSGQVSSQEEGAMEGVLVSARKTGASFTVTVVSDEKGHYAFPAAKLEPGHYTLSIRAGGYEPAATLARPRTDRRIAAGSGARNRPRNVRSGVLAILKGLCVVVVEVTVSSRS